MSSILWLASYPKSGNTWLRALLVNYLSDGDRPASINDLRNERTGHAAARVAFDELVGLEASMLRPEVIERLRPDVYRRLANEAPENLLLKAHDAWRATDAGEPLFPEDVTRGVVYLVRNPLDVTVSWAEHLGVPVAEAAARVCDGAPGSLSSPRLDDQLPQHVGGWSDHVRSWIDASGLPITVVRYEDLQADPESRFTDIVRFCGLPLRGDRIRTAVRFSGFAELRRQEQKQGFRERPPTARGDFFRHGEVGGWRRELTPQLTARVLEANHETMARFGYLDQPLAPEAGSGPGLGDRT